MSRKLSRIATMQILFAMDHRDEFTMDVAESFFESEWEKGEVEEMYRHVFSEKILADRLKDESNIPFTAGEKEYITNSVEVIVDNKEAIDKIIADHLKDGSIRRIAAVDLSILRVAVAEIVYHDDIAPAVSINEAVDLAKMYSSSDSARFVNGILGYILREGGHESH
ncbi:transcription antitermination factor NusB [Aedoeadaptatus pacaensis]|uniref:transcription antitermination factor NusB n=1 Tax=Aedoeadaptatus pacaensis TaxID=1776390 RepID=UPI000AEBD76B|nr:transcription antitermination factor NusB [Peptoniphilus pacaensis]